MRNAPQPLHKLADKIEPRYARAFRKAQERLALKIPLTELILAITAKDVKKAMSLIEPEIEPSMLMVGEIVKDTFLKGGAVGAEEVHSALV